MSDKDKAMLRFKIYIRKILKSFEVNNPMFVRTTETEKQYSEGAIRDLVERLLDDDINEIFRRSPKYKTVNSRNAVHAPR